MCMSLCFSTSNLSFYLFIFHFLRIFINSIQNSCCYSLKEPSKIVVKKENISHFAGIVAWLNALHSATGISILAYVALVLSVKANLKKKWKIFFAKWQCDKFDTDVNLCDHDSGDCQNQPFFTSTKTLHFFLNDRKFSIQLTWLLPVILRRPSPSLNHLRFGYGPITDAVNWSD